MLKIYDAVASIAGKKAAQEAVKILVEYFNFYITTDEIQELHINF